jgi:uncharacterized protein YkwD
LIRGSLLAALLMAMPLTAFADLASSINVVRLHGCNDRHGTPSALHRSRKLEAAARTLATGQDLHAATTRAGYRELKSASIQIANVPQDAQIQQVLSRQFCSQVTDPHFQELGTYRKGTDVWAVLATPFNPPTPREAAAISQRVLELTNKARASGRECGREPFAAAPPLTLAPLLEKAAMAHSKDMAMHDLFDHKGSDGSSPSDRVTRAGYKWRMIGENLASGVTTADEVVSGWLSSPHHCENIMGPRFTQMGVAYYYDKKSNGGIYWTQVFGTPAKPK